MQPKSASVSSWTIPPGCSGFRTERLAASPLRSRAANIPRIRTLRQKSAGRSSIVPAKHGDECADTFVTYVEGNGGYFLPGRDELQGEFRNDGALPLGKRQPRLISKMAD